MKAQFYIQFQAERTGPRGKVRAIKPARMTQRMPWEPLSDSTVVRFEVDLPDEAFDIPTVSVSIPIDPAQGPFVTVEALPVLEPEPVAS